MKVHEYQAKALLASFGVAVPKGQVATTAAAAATIAESMGGRVVVKAQVHAGGRGKAGGVKLVNTAAEAREVAQRLIGSRLVTHQTGPEGVPVPAVLIEETISVAKELYLSILIDGAAKTAVIMASEAGGMDIEEVAASTPEKIIKQWVDPIVGYQPFMGRNLAYKMGLPQDLVRPMADMVAGLYRAFVGRDCSLLEINPLVVTADNRLLAADAKITIDDNAGFRQKEAFALRDKSQEDPLEVEATETGVNNYIKLSGDIGCVVNGAGLAMATLDTISLYGGSAANFLDIGTVNNVERVVSAVRILTRDPDVKCIFFNIFGGMARVDVIAEGLVQAYREFNVQAPLVARLTGNGIDEGRKILAASGLPFIEAADMADGAQKAVAAAKGK
jgi:succinyl-CoA synthetase beta subunit